MIALLPVRGAHAQVKDGPSAASGDGGLQTSPDGGVTSGAAAVPSAPEGGAATPVAPIAPPNVLVPSPVPGPVVAPPEVRTQPPLPAAPPVRRRKPLQITVGLPPTAQDLGSEADIVSTADIESVAADYEQVRGWTFGMKGYIRAPMRIGIGPKNNGDPGLELHTPPRMVGLSSGDWTYIAIAPNPDASLYTTLSNPFISATIILASNTFSGTGFRDLDQQGGLSQAYLTLKFPDAFGSHGGLAWMVGAFSNRYGTAGPYQTSSGYYSTYLFGRTHVVGSNLTADLDLTDHWEIIGEWGFGAKMELIPFIIPGPNTLPDQPPKAAYLPGQQHSPEGSNFLHHAHVGLRYDQWLKLGAHWITSWTPTDNAPPAAMVGEGRITVWGGDIHLDSDKYGSAYIGYSHLNGNNLLVVADANQVLYSGTGDALKYNYFGDKDRFTSVVASNDYGTLDSINFQYIGRLKPLIGFAPGRRDLTLALYAMWNHARSPIRNPADTTEVNIDTKMLKFGGELEFAAFRYLSLSFRYDRVQPDLSTTLSMYQALSPRLILHSNWKSKEFIIVNYTRFILGPAAYPGSPYTAGNYTQSDPNLVMVSAVMSF
jgi:hypothetical protein